MPGPWEKYGGSATAEAAGPWSKYAATKEPRQYTPESEKRGKHSMTGREAKPVSVPNQALDLAEGTAKVGAIGTLPVAAAVDPLATVAGLAGGAAGGAGAKKLAEAAKLGPTAQRAAGDVGAVAGGGLAAKYGPRAVSALTPEFISKRAGALGDYLKGIRDRWNASAPAKPKPAPVKRPEPAWKSIPESAPEKPKPVDPIKAEWTPRTPAPKPEKPARPEPAWKAHPEPTTEKPAPVEPIKPPPRAAKLPTPKTATPAKSAAEQLRDELGGEGEIDPNTGVKKIPSPEDPRAADRAKLSPKGKNALPTPKTGANASAPADRSKMLSEALKAVGFTAEQAKALKPEDWHAIAQQVGIETPDQATVDEAIKSLK
jgi:hypothetical protein